ncbi:hypothetical protein QWZ08_10305 [Ferruginibacter paludis]|uniref:hypothetical protein n=1 Tax=Ferruginibacter paludis TaxID=1310417 RepID=UPI0025B5A930|nr:hypothetical protein [Ferruginibacter paludis]MDN3656019.1 hypothetical protein [Ferruginibacter paludis]
MYCKYGYILFFSGAYIYLQHDGMYIAIGVINYFYVIGFVIAIQIKVIDFAIFFIEFSFKTFQRFRLLEQF